MATRALAEREIGRLALDALKRIVTQHGLGVADVSLLVRQRGVCDDDGLIAEEAASRDFSGEKSIVARRQLAQLWTVLEAIHATLGSDGRCTQRELWYRLKTTGLFPGGPPLINERVLDACAVVSKRCGTAVRRENLGVIAAPKGSMTGCVTLLPPDGAPAQPLHTSVFQVPGDTEFIRALRFAADGRARCVLVVEKDSVFRRLVADGFSARFPSVLVTASGYPDLATRTLVGCLVDALGVRCFALTDYNPHGLALMLAYKHGTKNLGLEGGSCCPTLQWLGLRAAHVPKQRQVHVSMQADDGEPAHADVDDDEDEEEEDDDNGDEYTHRAEAAVRDARREPLGLPPDAFQPFTARDRTLLTNLLRRADVGGCADLAREAEAMLGKGVKVEIEALYAFGFDYLWRFVEERILHFDDEREREAEALGGGDARWARARARGPTTAMRVGGGECSEERCDEEYAATEESMGMDERLGRCGFESLSSSSPPAQATGESCASWDDDERFLLEEPPDW